MLYVSRLDKILPELNERKDWAFLKLFASEHFSGFDASDTVIIVIIALIMGFITMILMSKRRRRGPFSFWLCFSVVSVSIYGPLLSGKQNIWKMFPDGIYILFLKKIIYHIKNMKNTS